MIDFFLFCFFQLDQADRNGGRAVTWKDSLRLKSLVTGEYLSGFGDTLCGPCQLARGSANERLVFNYVKSTSSSIDDRSAHLVTSAF